MDLSSAVRQLRKARGYTQIGLSEEAGYSSQVVHNIELGDGQPYPYTLRDVALALGVPPGLFVQIMMWDDLSEAEQNRIREMYFDALMEEPEPEPEERRPRRRRRSR